MEVMNGISKLYCHLNPQDQQMSLVGSVFYTHQKLNEHTKQMLS